MTKHRLNDCTYALDPVFPGVFVAPGVGVAGWEGPQLIVPGDLSLDKSAAILLTDESKQSLERVLKSGYPKDKIYKMSDFLAYFKSQDFPSTNTRIQIKICLCKSSFATNNGCTESS